MIIFSELSRTQTVREKKLLVKVWKRSGGSNCWISKLFLLSHVFQNVRIIIEIDHTRSTTCLDEDDGSDTTSEQGGILFLSYFDKLFPWVYILSNAHCWAKCSPDKLLYLSLTVLPQPNYRFQVPPQPFTRKKIWHQLCWKVWSDFHLQYHQEAVVIRNMIFNFGKGWVLQFYGYRVENQSINRSSPSTPFVGGDGGD